MNKVTKVVAILMTVAVVAIVFAFNNVFATGVSLPMSSGNGVAATGTTTTPPTGTAGTAGTNGSATLKPATNTTNTTNTTSTNTTNTTNTTGTTNKVAVQIIVNNRIVADYSKDKGENVEFSLKGTGSQDVKIKIDGTTRLTRTFNIEDVSESVIID